jgi:hypothetical protein
MWRKVYPKNLTATNRDWSCATGPVTHGAITPVMTVNPLEHAPNDPELGDGRYYPRFAVGDFSETKHCSLEAVCRDPAKHLVTLATPLSQY